MWTRSVLDNKLTRAGEGFGCWIQKSLSYCSLARGLPATLAKVTSAVMSLNCCTVTMGPWGKGGQTKQQRERRPGFRVKHPMLQNSENNELKRFQKQTSFVPLQCLLESCYADMSLIKNNPADLRTNSLQWKDQWKEKAPSCSLVLLQICSRQQHELQHKFLRTKYLHIFVPSLPLPGRTQDQGLAFTTGILMALKALLFTQALSTDLWGLTSAGLSQYQGRCSARQSQEEQTPHKEGSGQVTLANCHLPPRFAKPKYKQRSSYLTSKQVPAILCLKKGKPITQEQGYLDLLLTPSVTLRAPLFQFLFLIHKPALGQVSPTKTSKDKTTLISRDGRSPFELTKEQNCNKH